MPGEVIVVDPHPGAAQNVDPLFPATEYTAQQILAATGAVPSGAATAANQVEGNDLVDAILSRIAAGVKDGGEGWISVFGVGGIRFTSGDQSGGVGPVTDSPTSGQKLVITDIEISVDTAMRVDFSSNGTLIASIYMAANSTVNLATRSKRKLAVADKTLDVQTSVPGNIAVGAFYYSEA